MLYLLRWPNGDCRVLDPGTLRASHWLSSEPSELLASFPRLFDVGKDDDGGHRCFANTADTIASDAPGEIVNAWMPPDFELVRSYGSGEVQAAVAIALAATAARRAQRVERNLRRLMHYDEVDL
jgi:hypothetical protein